MKKNLFKLMSVGLLGGLLGLVAVPSVFEVKAGATGDLFSLVTDLSTLKDSDQILLVGKNGSDYYATGSYNSSYTCMYMEQLGVEGSDLYVGEGNAKVITLGKSGSNYTFNYKEGDADRKIGACKAPNNNICVTSKSGASFTWTIEDSASLTNAARITNTNTTYGIFQFSYGNNRFSNYKTTSGMSDIFIYKKSGIAKEVRLGETEIEFNVGFTTTVSVEECIGFTPENYSWEVTDGDDVIQIDSGANTSEVVISSLKEGEAELTVDVDGIKASANVTVTNYQYDLTSDKYFITVPGAMLGNDTSYIKDVDFGDNSNLWNFEKAFKGDNTYYLKNSDSKFLTYSEDHIADGKNISEIEVTDSKYNVWTVTYDSTNGYKVLTQTKTHGVRSLATHEEKWFAFDGNNYVSLLETGTFDHYEVTALPTTKQYFVGDTLKPLNCHVMAYYSNGYEAEITKDIVWETLTEGTVAYGTYDASGETINIEMDGLKIYKGDASTFEIEGLKSNLFAGERINKDLLTVSITYILAGNDDIKKVLTKDDYTVSPEVVANDTTSIRFSLAKDPTVYVDKAITVAENHFVSANYVGEGDIISIGTLSYNPTEITGGVELAHNGTSFTYENFGLMPHGELKFEVGKKDGYYTLKDTASNKYLVGDNSSLKFLEPDVKSATKNNDDSQQFNLSITIGGHTKVVTMETSAPADFTYTNAFSSFTYINESAYTGSYITGISDLFNNKLLFDYYDASHGYEITDHVEIKLASWEISGGIFVYSIDTGTVLTDECLFTLSYDDYFEEWVISSKPHQDKQLYFNEQGNKFGFYTSGTNYDPIMIYRDNTKPLQGTLSSVSVSLAPGFETVTVGTAFPWTSALVVTAHYEGGAFSVVPVGGYKVTLPDTSKIGTATGKVFFGQEGHQVEKSFTVKVTGHTTEFDVVCKNPVLVGETYQAHLEVEGHDYTPPVGEPVTWSVSDSTLASIDQNGNVTGLKPGYIDVIATSFDGTHSDFEHIQIYKQVESVTLNKNELTLKEGENFQLEATVLPADASNKKVSYKSSDPSVAFVDEITGLIEAVKKGSATITCSAQNHPERNYDVCEVTVTEGEKIPVTGITLDCNYKEIEVKDTFKLVPTITPSNATIKGVIWSSNHENIATVSSDGTVKGIAKGECVITAKTADGGFTAQCTIKVKTSAEVIHVESVFLSETSKTLNVDDEFTLTATVLPGNADNKSVKWESSNTSVATVDNKGYVKAVGAGNAVITVTTNDGGKTATCVVTVIGPTPTPVHVDSVSLSKTSSTLTVGGEETLTATINPSNADNKNVTWSSSNTSIATVDQNGKVTAIKEGTVLITVTTADGEKTASCAYIITNAGPGPNPDPTPTPTPENREGTIVLASLIGVSTVGIGCAIFIPIGVHRKHIKLGKNKK